MIFLFLGLFVIMMYRFSHENISGFHEDYIEKNRQLQLKVYLLL